MRRICLSSGHERGPGIGSQWVDVFARMILAAAVSETSPWLCNAVASIAVARAADVGLLVQHPTSKRGGVEFATV